MFRKIFTAAVTLVLTASIFAGCSAPEKDNGRLSVVCTVFPVFDWTREVIGDSDNIDLTCLMKGGADLHNYQPSADDMILMSDCDVFICVGGESESWVEDSLRNARNKDMKVIRLMDVLGSDLREEEVKEGMETPEEEEEEEAYDEHIWLSLRNAEKCTAAIAEKLAEADSVRADTYTKNSEKYSNQLGELDDMYADMTANAANKTLIFGDRFPFRYLFSDYGLDYYAAFSGCSSDSEASFETIAFLADKCDELGAEYIFTIDNSDCTIADAVAASTKKNAPSTLTLYSMQSVDTNGEEKADYYDYMYKNYTQLREALS
ncbi:MAG: metal ABC transporter substrate-binding protein [Ruminococcus sp.]|nr:metal ABC transporter substrate-binding protein [Ruminococcus sp.]